MTNIARHSFLCTLNVDKRPEQRVEERRKKEADRCPRDYDDSDRGDFDESGPCFL